MHVSFEPCSLRVTASQGGCPDPAFSDRGRHALFLAMHACVSCQPFFDCAALVFVFYACSARRDVWHGDDMAGAGQRRARWNEALLESAVAPAYAALLQEAAVLLGSCADFWRLLPLGQGSVPEPWLKVAAAVYARLAGRPVLYSPVDGGKWLAPARALLPDAACYSTINTTAGSGADSNISSMAGDAVARLQLVAADSRGNAAALGFLPPPLQASMLAGLLLQCGVPLVMGLSQEQQRCMLQWSSMAQVRAHEEASSGPAQGSSRGWRPAGNKQAYICLNAVCCTLCCEPAHA